MRMTAASTTRLTNNGLSDKILISDYHLSEPITVDTQSSMDVDSCGTTQWDTSSASNSQSTLHNDQINMNRNDLTVNVTALNTSTAANNNNNHNSDTSNSTHRMNTSLSYIPPGLVSVINESNCLTVCAIGHFSIGHTWGPYLIHIGSELRQKLTAFSTELDPDFLITLSVKSKDANYENVNSLIVGEEHTWIRVIHETGLRSDKNEYNLDILVDPILKTITLQVKCDINPQDSLIGVVRIVLGNHKVSDQITMSSCHSSTLFSSTKSIASSTPPSMSTNTTSTGPRRDKKCTHCGISFSNMDTLNAHMTHYCSRRPGLISSNTTTSATTTTSIIQPSTSVTITSSEASTNNKVTPVNKFSQNSTSAQRQNSSQSTGSIPGNFNSNVNSCNPIPISRYSTVEENGLSGLNSLAAPPIPEVSAYDSVQMSNLINPTLLNLFGVNNGSDISQIFQNPIASFMLPMLSRLIPPPPPPPPPPTPNATGDAPNQSNSNALSPTLLTSMKRPCLAPEKLRSNHSSEASSSLSSSNFCETRVSPTQTIAHIINQNSNTGSNFTDQHTPKVLFCPNCQQLYTSQYLSTLPSKSSKLEPFSLTSSSSYELSSVNNPPSIEGVDSISRQNETIWNLSQLSEAAHRFGLILAAPLVTANGLQYIPVNLSSKFTNRRNTEKQHHSNNPQSINKKRQSTTPNPSCEITNDSLNCVNITSPSSSSSVSSSLINPPGNKPRDAPMPRLNTPNILDLSINPHNPQLLNSLALYNAINEFRDVQQQQQQQHQEQPDQSYFSPQLVPPGKRDISDTMKDSSHNANHRSHHHLSNMNSSSKVLGNSEDIRANRLPISNNNNNNNQKSNEDGTIMPTEMSLLQAFSNILSYTNELLSNSQSIPFPFNINQLLLMLYASLAANSMNMTAQTTPNLSTLIPTPVSVTGNSVAPNNAGTNPVNISCPIITRVTENCDTNVVSDSLPPAVNNIFKGYSPFSSNVPFPPICINPLIPSNDQAVNTANSSNLQSSFPNHPAPVSTAAAAATTTPVTGTNTTNIPSHLFQSLNSPSVHKMDPNSVGNIFTNVSNNNSINNNNGSNSNNNMNSSSLLNILPALKLLGSIFPHFSTTEYQQEAQATQATSEMSVNPKQAKLQSNRSNANNNNNEQITSPPGSPQSSILRPYLCRFCRTRFQAFSTFQAHQQFYCQGRKEVMKQLQTTKTTSSASDTLASTSSSTTLSCLSSTGPSANKRRCTTSTTPENASSSQLQTLGGVSISQRNSANSSSTSSSGDEGDILKNNNNNNRLSPLNAKSSPNRNLLSSQEGIADYETDQLTQLAQWEPCGTSELRCSACGYVGQTPRGMKMHRKLHECNGTTFKTATRSTSEAKTRNDIKLESDNLTNSSDVSLHHGNDSNSSSSNDGRNLNNNSNNNNINVANDSNSAFSDDHVKKEHL